MGLKKILENFKKKRVDTAKKNLNEKLAHDQKLSCL